MGGGQIRDADKNTNNDVVGIGDSVVQDDEAEESSQGGQENLSRHAI